MYQTRARDWHNENIGLRKFSSAMSVRNLANDVPDEAVDALLDTSRAGTQKSSSAISRSRRSCWALT
ncbi:MAG: hypothetical protein M0C28_34050 [Candidatus Moduliflexus flocculans]|nr:hypothetical protein [Candidatus Moduliflexus flocculans]